MPVLLQAFDRDEERIRVHLAAVLGDTAHGNRRRGRGSGDAYILREACQQECQLPGFVVRRYGKSGG